ncbi:tubulin-specific chaperone A-like [Andrena cerasifolii]|uniref:tubulin-specific chaperone A-like n=1 Tax=Andrena cerasifolii TaxID=2819439 RepID=UPI004037EF91
MSDPRIRTLKIKTGVVKRLAREKFMYEKEAGLQRAWIQKLREQGEDAYHIMKQEEVLQESLMMVPDCQRRLVKAFEELKGILCTEQDLKEIDEYIEAEEVLKEAETELPNEGEVMEMC